MILRLANHGLRNLRTSNTFLSIPRPGLEPGTSRLKRGVISISPPRQHLVHVFSLHSGRQGIRTLISFKERRVSNAVRPSHIRLPSMVFSDLCTVLARVGFEPTAFLILNQSGLPVAYRAAPAARKLNCESTKLRIDKRVVPNSTFYHLLSTFYHLLSTIYFLTKRKPWDSNPQR